MKRALPIAIIVLAMIVATAAVVALASKAAWQRAGRLSWPEGLGTLEQFEVPRRETDSAALRLLEIARPLNKRPEIAEYVKREHVRNVPEIAPPPAAVAAYIEEHAREIDAVRDHLLRAEEMAWGDVPDLLALKHLARLLIARALMQGSWDDLRAASVIGQSLHSRPELMSQLIALELARAVNAAAWKMPLPPPAWLAEFHAVDHRRLILRALQHDTWMMWKHATNPYMRMSLANMAVHQRKTASEIASVTSCGFDDRAYFARRLSEVPRWNIPARVAVPTINVWSRMLRYRAETEATANALRIRAGMPFIEQSACGDGAWRFENGRLFFTNEPPRHDQKAVVMPLNLVLVQNPPMH